MNIQSCMHSTFISDVIVVTMIICTACTAYDSKLISYFIYQSNFSTKHDNVCITNLLAI